MKKYILLLSYIFCLSITSCSNKSTLDEQIMLESYQTIQTETLENYLSLLENLAIFKENNADKSLMENVDYSNRIKKRLNTLEQLIQLYRKTYEKLEHEKTLLLNNVQWDTLFSLPTITFSEWQPTFESNTTSYTPKILTEQFILEGLRQFEVLQATTENLTQLRKSIPIISIDYQYILKDILAAYDAFISKNIFSHAKTSVFQRIQQLQLVQYFLSETIVKIQQLEMYNVGNCAISSHELQAYVERITQQTDSSDYKISLITQPTYIWSKFINEPSYRIIQQNKYYQYIRVSNQSKEVKGVIELERNPNRKLHWSISE